MGIREIMGGEVKKVLSDSFYVPEDTVKGFEDTIRPIINAKPTRNNFSRESHATGVFYVTPEQKDFYLTHVLLSAGKSPATDGDVFHYVSCVLPNGKTAIYALRFRICPACTQNQTASIPLKPILLKRNSNVIVTSNADVGGVTVTGFIEESYRK